MEKSNRTATYIGIVLIGAGLLFLVINLIPGLGAGLTWPIVFYALAACFYLPSVIWSDMRKSLSGLYIPGSVMLVLGLMFTYNVLTQDWASWAFGWTIIPAGVGFGLILSAKMGEWGKAAAVVGFWLLIGSLAFFSLFAALFGGTLLKFFGPLLLICAGIFMLVGSFGKWLNTISR